jgi:predicted outer membrane protein
VTARLIVLLLLLAGCAANEPVRQASPAASPAVTQAPARPQSRCEAAASLAADHEATWQLRQFALEFLRANCLSRPVPG